MSTNPARQRLMSPLDYLGAMAGYKPPEPQPPMMPMYDAQFRVHPPQPILPSGMNVPMQIPPEVIEARRRMGW